MYERFSARCPLKGESGSLFCSLDVETRCKFFIRLSIIWKVSWGHFYVMERVLDFKNVPIFWSNYNIDLGSFGQLLSLFYKYLNIFSLQNIIKNYFNVSLNLYRVIIKLIKIISKNRKIKKKNLSKSMKYCIWLGSARF